MVLPTGGFSFAMDKYLADGIVKDKSKEGDGSYPQNNLPRAHKRLTETGIEPATS